MTKRAIKLCKEDACKNEQTTMGYCRLHYLKNCRKIREKQKKKAAQSLNKYIDFIMKKHPDNYVETIKHDLRHAGRFQQRAEEYFSDDGFNDVMGEVDMGQEVERIVGNLKVDETV
ncbi:MAG TPA: hypothetical protein DDW49_02195 [Deltaproteobacteria bacterium]|nr:MAG: hypothetical protein A2048_00795 [Deltaproteobacteria bacterium GWA2_45_12]HBF12195.1 hypothetical protein [Deltaproteobacteria bacterium]